MFLFRRILIGLITLCFFAATPFAYGAGGMGGTPHDEFGNTIESLQQQIRDLEATGKTDEATLKTIEDLQKDITSLEGTLELSKTAIPSLFEEGGGCTFSGDASGGTVSCNRGILGSPCEVVMSGLRSNKEGGIDVRTLTCTEFVDPLPAKFMRSTRDSGTYCIQQTNIASGTTSGDDNQNTFTYASTYDSEAYCIGLLHKTGEGELTPILGFVMFVYNLMQPLLIVGGVIAIVIAGIFIMFAPGGEGDTIKKGKDMLIKIISGFLLFFMIKVFLSTINGSFFGSTAPTSGSTTENTAPSNNGTETFRGDAITTPGAA